MAMMGLWPFKVWLTEILTDDCGQAVACKWLRLGSGGPQMKGKMSTQHVVAADDWKVVKRQLSWGDE